MDQELLDPPLDEIIRRGDLPRYVGLRRTAIDELVKLGEFPAPVPLSDGGRAVGWLKREVAAWQAARLAKRGGR